MEEPRVVPRAGELAEVTGKTQRVFALDGGDPLGPLAGLGLVELDLAAAIGSVEDLDALLYLVTGEAARLLGSDMASLFLLEERGDVLLGRAQVGMSDDAVVGARILVAEWPEAGEVLRTGRPAVHARADQVRGPERPYVERFGIRSYVAVRLGTQSRPLGVLFVNYAGRRHRFTRPELAFVETLTSYLSVTIERARLVSVLREAVTSLQAAVLPSSFPVVPGLDVGALYRSASILESEILPARIDGYSSG